MFLSLFFHELLLDTGSFQLYDLNKEFKGRSYNLAIPDVTSLQDYSSLSPPFFDTSGIIKQYNKGEIFDGVEN